MPAVSMSVPKEKISHPQAECESVTVSAASGNCSYDLLAAHTERADGLNYRSSVNCSTARLASRNMRRRSRVSNINAAERTAAYAECPSSAVDGCGFPFDGLPRTRFSGEP